MQPRAIKSQLTKLTLSVPEDVLIAAKNYSKQAKTSLSQLVSSYFSSLAEFSRPHKTPSKSSLVDQLAGIIPIDNSVDADDLLYQSLKAKYGI